MSTSAVPLFGTHTRVVCFGNRLHGDDAFGCHVHDALAAHGIPGEASLHDAGTSGLGAVLFFEGCRRAIVVDAIGPSKTPGRLRALSVREALDVDRPLSTHAQGLGYLFSALSIALPSMPAITIVGVDIDAVDTFCETLSRPVACMVEPARDMVLDFLCEQEAG